MTITVRAAVRDDAAAVAALHVATWQVGYHGLLPEQFLACLSVSEREHRWTRLIDAGTPLMVAEAHQQVVGFAAYGQNRDEDLGERVGELYALYVHPQWWGAGIGRRLHDTALVTLAGPYVAATLWVLEGNRRARLFYERQAWVPSLTARVEDIGGVSLRELRYTRALSPGGSSLGKRHDTRP